MSLKPITDKDFCASQPVRVAVTGGIGSGKSYVCRRLEAAGHPVFYCDDEAKRIIRTDTHVRCGLTSLVGPDLYSPDGILVKPVLAAYLCGGPRQAARVDAIVHPRVAQAFEVWAAAQAGRHAVVFMECALLFEAGFDRLVHFAAAVTVPPAVRLERLMARDRISEEKARAWMALQLPEEEKCRRAHFLLRNGDGDRRLNADIAAMLAAVACGQAGRLPDMPDSRLSR